MADVCLYFSFHQILVKVITNDQNCADFIQTDFSYFYQEASPVPPEPDITISVFLQEPPLDRIPEGVPVSFYTKDAAVIREKLMTYFDYSGEALVIHDDQKDASEIYSSDRNFLFEKTYLMVMSRLGVELDRRHLHRIHAMGVVFKSRAMICLMPMGGGKTTLTLSLLENKAVSLLSDEVPLVASDGRLYAMPIRLGVRADTRLSIAKDYLKPFQRSRYGPKILIDVHYYRNQIASVADPGIVFVGRRENFVQPKIVKISRIKAFVVLFRLCVIGTGLPELLEYSLRFDMLNIFRRIKIFYSRFAASLAMIRRSATYELQLSADRHANAALVIEFLENH